MTNVAIISAGHHDKDPGAIGNGYKEADITKLIRAAVLEHLEALNVYYMNDEDYETNSVYQTRIRPVVNKIIFDIHLNAASPSANGSEVIVAHNASTLSKSFASDILEDTCTVLGTRSRGIIDEFNTPRKKLGILNMSGIACLVEVCFISNKDEMDKLMSEGTIDRLGAAYAKTIKKYVETALT